jgi:hypothetical protein
MEHPSYAMLMITIVLLILAVFAVGESNKAKKSKYTKVYLEYVDHTKDTIDEKAYNCRFREGCVNCQTGDYSGFVICDIKKCEFEEYWR